MTDYHPKKSKNRQMQNRKRTDSSQKGRAEGAAAQSPPPRLSLRWRIIGLLLICWLIPVALMIGILGVYVAGHHGDMTAENFQEQLEFSNQICIERLNGVISASRQASYDGELLSVWNAYQMGMVDKLKAGKEYKDYLSAKYLKNNAISSAILWFGEAQAQDSFYSVYNEHANGSYQQIRTYQEKDHAQAEKCAEELGTGIRFFKCDNRLYLIRNLINSRYQTQGTLVFCLNPSYCFQSLEEYQMVEGVRVLLGKEKLELRADDRLTKWSEAQDAADVCEWQGGRLYLKNEMRGDNYTLQTSLLFEKEVTQYPFYGYPYVLLAMLAGLIPILFLMFVVFRRQVTHPISVLCESSAQIERGDLGYQITEKMENAEFAYLAESFNHMSENLKQQFDRIYEEEIALREARIMALQSHINPHFMNNTLEIINWEARLGDNEKVSKMIGALSTMLDAALDRKKHPQVHLSEEMTYVDSYLYIMKERLGKRLTIEKEIPEELLDYYVPRLCLQPVIENAIEHGVVPNGSGTVRIVASKDERYLYLTTINGGGMSEEDRARITRLLDANYNTGKEPSGNLGIANVNQRLRILCGEPCGLSITEEQDGIVEAKLTMTLNKTGI